MEWDKIWAINRKNIDPIAGKYTCVEKSKACVLTLTDLGNEEIITTHPIHQKNETLGTKPVFHSNKLYLEADDVKTLKEGEKITLMKLGNVLIEKIVALDGGLFDIKAKTMFDDKDYKNTVKLTWLIANDSILTNVKLFEYGHLMNKASLDENDKFEDHVNKNSVFVTECWADPCAKTLPVDYFLQFERRAYFRVDKRVQTGDDSSVTLECILIPDGKTKAMCEDKGKIDNKEFAKGAGSDARVEKKKAEKAKGKEGKEGEEAKGPSKKDLQKAAKKAKKDDMKANPDKKVTEAPAENGGKPANVDSPKKHAQENKEIKTEKPKIAMVPAKAMETFSIADDNGISELEGHFKTNLYLSGKDLPSQNDAKLLEQMEKLKFTPDQNKHQNIFAWWWTLVSFQPAAREMWI